MTILRRVGRVRDTGASSVGGAVYRANDNGERVLLSSMYLVLIKRVRLLLLNTAFVPTARGVDVVDASGVVGGVFEKVYIHSFDAFSHSLHHLVLIIIPRSNLQRYIRLSEHLATKPLRIDKFRHQLSKLSAYHAKFSYLFSRIKVRRRVRSARLVSNASSDKMRLMQLRDVYQEACRMLRDQLDEERKRRREAQAHFVLLRK
ncbi:hypothetical protein EYR38_007238 [Pleurotus pulmonarius]|nr:hypothetical protein EYR38_007238 [Pleurotus pulmonarius]